MTTQLSNPTVWIMGIIITAFISGAIGSFFTGKGKVSSGACKERRESSNALIMSEIKAVKELVQVLIDNNRARLAAHEKRND